MTFDLNQEIVKLLMDEPFYAALSRRIDKKASTASSFLSTNSTT